MDNLYTRLVESLHENEYKDFEAICSILDKKVRLQSRDVAIISDDPYLLVLIFISLIRYEHIRIHIINPLEGEEEINRLIGSMDIDFIISTDKIRSNWFGIYIDNIIISNEHRYDIPEVSNTDFTITTYSPYPCKVYQISSKTFSTILHCLINDLSHYNLINYFESGAIPFISNNPDYLLYFIALKLTIRQWGDKRILSEKDDINYPLEHSKSYREHNDYKTLSIPKKEFIELWDNKIQTIFEHKLFFKLNLKHSWVVNLFIKRRLNKLFKGFSNLLIIGVLPNAWMIDILKTLRHVKVYTIFPIKSAMYYGAISDSFEYVFPDNTEWKLERFIEGNNKTHLLSSKLFDTENETVCCISDAGDRFSMKVIHNSSNINTNKYYLLGNIKNSFNNKNVYIFPETLEKVINSYPFIKDCALLTFNKKVTLVINPNQQILDSNRINNGMFNCIIQKQIDTLNKELPDEYQIRGFVVSTSLIEKDRVGDIVRYPFNRINSL
jgi:hypothetical protein